MSTPKQSLLKESKIKKRNKILLWGIFIIIFVFLLFITIQKKETIDKAQDTEIHTVQRKTIERFVSSDGNIINPDIANLSFFINGTLDEIFVQEGENVTQGQLLAQLDTQDLLFDLRSAKNDVAIAQATIEAKKAGVTETDIRTTQQNLEKAYTQKENAQKEAQKNQDQAFETTQTTLQKSISEVNNILVRIDQIMGIKRHYPEETIRNIAFHDSITESLIIQMHESITRYSNDISKRVTPSTMLEYHTMSKHILDTQILLDQTYTLLMSMIDLFQTAVSNTRISEPQINTARDDIQNSLQTINNLQNTITQNIQSIESAQLNQQNIISQEQKNIESALIALQNSEETTNERRISKETGLSIEYARLEQAKLRVEKAEYNMSLARLTSPIDGVVIEVNGSKGESLKAETTNSDNAFIKIISASNFTTEVFVEEVDIARIFLGQSVRITLDAIADVTLEGEVSFISSIAQIDNNGIVTYLVRIKITEDYDAPIREGMSAYVDFIEVQSENTLTIPIESVSAQNTVILENGEIRDIKTGVDDGQYVEVLEGLQENDRIKNPFPLELNNSVSESQLNSNTLQDTKPQTLSPQRIENMKSAGLSDQDIQQIQNGNFTDEMREKIKNHQESNSEGSGFNFGGTRRR